MEFKDTQAIYLQIRDYICEQILLSRWKEGERIPSVREMGIMLEVNPNTAMRTYELLQNMEIVLNKRGVGFFVCQGATDRIITQQRKEFIEQELPAVFKNMLLLEMSLDDLKNEYEKYLNSHNINK